jgi:hypothetical protein
MGKIINAFFFVLFMAFITIVMVEWASGCGQTWTDSAGKEHMGQCWIIGK